MVWRRLAAAVVATLGLLALPAPPAFARHVCQNQVTAGQVIKGTPAEDQVFAPAALAQLATGAGVRVAVIDSGVDAEHPQLRGQVAAGQDFLHGDPDARQDCVGHGTAVASLIAAKPVDGTGFRGLAPGATIVPVRVSEQDEFNGKTSGDHVSFTDFARSIDWAVQQGRARVINLSLVTTVDSPPVRDAIARAIDAGVVVVAAAGNHGKPEDGNPTPYPAAYPGVIGVGAITADGVKASFSQHGDYVDLVAPGDRVTVATLVAGQQVNQGTSFSAPFVAATAALILQRFPGATPAEVTRRLEATADPSPAGQRSDDYGYGLLNPYRALTETLGPDSPAVPVPQMMHPEDPATLALAARRDHARGMALLIAAVGAGAVLLIAAAAIIVRRGRRRGWVSAAASGPPETADGSP